MLDTLATRYHCLPSEVVQRGDTLDILVMDIALNWERYQRELAEAKYNNKPPPAPKLSQGELKAMMERVRSK